METTTEKVPQGSRFAAKLVRLRKTAGLSQEELGARIGVAQSHVAKMEKGRSWLTQAQLSRLVWSLRSYFPWLSADYLILDLIPEAPDVEQLQALAADERVVWEIVQDLGAPEARRRLVLAGHTFERKV